ncbi:choice-of-anchor D domain-containing protein [Nakamurella flava]|uniref:Choice-of-anchor D domain-containing protein n=1 Tax=Nakamurella flava TaxID=2576308 RepID=A0A4V6CSH5_9ACTN|nr:ricin-type beta-trefoil lectin domain protein [Nakamurella flava]TKV61555.1 choice-of-anchor D domain-containing protein [Nakamurella flava]
MQTIRIRVERVRRKAVAILSATALVVTGTLAGSIPAAADNTTVSYDNNRTGWDPNQPGLGPSDVSAADFGQLFATQLDGQIYAQPVIAKDTLLAVTENNKAYGLDPKSGAIRWTRDVGRPWPASAIGCGDLVPNIGITATPVVDPATGTAYFTSKVNDGPTVDQPSWYMHAVDITTGRERSGFPTKIAGSPTNNPANTFNAKTAMQRPGLLLLDGVVYASFASHCDYGAYVGYVIGFDATSGRQTTMWATETGSSSDGAGIWHSGGGLVSDGPGRIFFTTGNGVSPPPGPGQSPPGTLGESVVRLQVNSDRSLVSKDFFSPVNNTNLDRDDVDFGSGSPMAIPDGFGTAANPHLMVQVGKDGRVFLLDRDKLGGMGQGPGKTDAVLQTVGPYNGVWGHPAFWGGDGGYVYMVTNGGPLSAFKIGVAGNGLPSLTRTGTSTGWFGYTSGSPAVTSDGTKSGTALVWAVYSSGSNGSGGQIRAFEAVPRNGQMVLRYSAPIGTATKFAKPATDGGRVYTGTRDGVVFGFGRPTTVALSGSPTDFGSVAVGATATKSVTVTAVRDVTVTGVSTSGDGFRAGGVTVPAQLKTGQTLTVPVSFTPGTPTSLSGALNFATSAGPLGFDLHGLGTRDGLLSTPASLDFEEVPTGGVVTLSANITNTGTTSTTITGVDLPPAPYRVAAPPTVGSTIAAGQSVSVPIAFAPTAAGTVDTALVVRSSTGTVRVPLSGEGVVGAPKLTLTPNVIDFGAVPVGQTATKYFDIVNEGNLALTLNKAAPPAAPFDVADPVAEGQELEPLDTIRQAVSFKPTASGEVTGTYIITGNDGQGAQQVQVRGTGTSGAAGQVVGPGGKCLDVREARSADGTPVQIYTCNGSGAQKWTVRSDQSLRAFGKCLDVAGGGTTNGTPVQLWSCNGSGAQVWVPQGDGSLRNPQSGRCLDVPGGNAVDGQRLQLWDCNGSGAQQWRVASSVIASGPVVGPQGSCLDVRGGNPTDGARVQRWDCNGTEAQTWNVGSDQTVRALGKCLDVAGGGTVNFAPVQIWTCNGSGAQVWVQQGLALKNPQSGRCLDIPGGNLAKGVALQLYDCNSTVAQRWSLPVSSIAVGQIIGLAGKCADVREARTDDGTPVQLYACNTSKAQQWNVSSDRTLRAQGKCLDVAGGGTTNGSALQIYTCNGSGAQVWVEQGDTLRNPQSGKCLDVPAGNPANGNRLQIWDCNGSAAQRWALPV